jgi:hypothetical protein
MSCWLDSSVPNRALGSCPDPEILGTSDEKACEGGAAQAKPDPASPDAEEGGSRDPAAMEET